MTAQGEGGGGPPACAACKHQRKRCSPDCALAPYFPASQPKTFLNVHRLFGIRNVMKTLKQIDEDDDRKSDTMKSIIFEADMRDRFPVLGCVEYIQYLNQCVKEAEDELVQVLAQLTYYQNVLIMSGNDHTAGPVFGSDEEEEEDHESPPYSSLYVDNHNAMLDYSSVLSNPTIETYSSYDDD
ncbi:unnamed protein product [Cuscuta europaea]|uniref:LOB domain-containing protein n=1 Tax=Cuscuta europaea TaxID=41803 RepID=A0A9P1EAT9_CUSEU|nr:unnamed protein product [Cuscuta europaea]